LLQNTCFRSFALLRCPAFRHPEYNKPGHADQQNLNFTAIWQHLQMKIRLQKRLQRSRQTYPEDDLPNHCVSFTCLPSWMEHSGGILDVLGVPLRRTSIRTTLHPATWVNPARRAPGPSLPAWTPCLWGRTQEPHPADPRYDLLRCSGPRAFPED